MTTSLCHKTLPSQDDPNRTIEYAVQGSQRPDAYVFVMAYVSENWTWPVPWHQSYESLNIKSISVSLPGLGSTSPNPGYKISEWPRTDLNPILVDECVDNFVMWGIGYGCMHAMAAVQHFGPDRVLALGLRGPYVPLSVSTENKLQRGPDAFPSTEDVLNNSLGTTVYRFLLEHLLNPVVLSEPGGWVQYIMNLGLLGPSFQSIPKFANDYPEEMNFLKSLIESGAITANGLMYALAKDVALDCQGLDIPSIQFSGKSIVVWYANDDSDCPPSHGEWLENHFQARWTRVFNGYGHYSASLLDMDVFFHRLIDCCPPED